ncbi:MAG TPA: hypothetical protein VGL61_33680 [Kofleriaceae bacterium]|jgi:hypothetical protein
MSPIDLADLQRVIGGAGSIDFDHGADAAIEQTRKRADVCRALQKAAGDHPQTGTDQDAFRRAGNTCWFSLGQ